MNQVLHLADFASPYPGNFIFSILALAAHLKDRLDARLVLGLPNEARDRNWIPLLHEAGIKVRFVPRTRFSFSSYIQASDLVRTTRPLLVHTHFTSYDALAALASFPYSRTIPLIWHCHSLWPIASTIRRRIKDRLKFGILSGRAKLVAVSDAVAVQLKGRGANPAQICVIPNGIDFSRIDASQTAPTSRTTFVALIFAWEPYSKGLDLAIAAIQQLRNSGFEATLVVVGEDRTRDYISSVGGGDTSSWLRVLPPRSDVLSLYNTADVFISASRTDAFSYSLAEAMGAGLLAVASDIPGTNWCLGAPGIRTFPSGDSTALARCLEELFTLTPEQRAHLGLGNSRFVRDRLSLDRWVDSVLQLYREVTRPTWAQ